MSEQNGVSFLDPSTGLLDDVDVTIKSLRAVEFKPQNSNDGRSWPAIKATLVTGDGKEIVEHAFAGTMDKLRPSPDGLQFLPNQDGAKISDIQPAYKLVVSLINGIRGVEDTKAAEKLMTAITAAPGRLDHYDGINFRVQRVAEKREGKKDGSFILAAKVNTLPGAGKATTKATTKAAPKSTPAATAAPAAAAEASDDAAIAGLLVAAVQKAGGSLDRNKVATGVYQEAKAAGLDWKTIMKRANEEDFLQFAAAEPVTVGDDVVALSYDGAKVTIA